MTTAHRPTFDTARGGTGRNEGDLSKLSVQYSSKDMPSHTKLKYRQTGQSTSEELRSKDLRRELQDRERTSRRTTASSSAREPTSSKKPRLEQIAASENVDADDPDEEPDSDEDSDEDDTAELMAELNRIKKERAAEKAKQEAERADEEERIRTENILQGNPLLQPSGKSDFKVKRRWDDDVVFKNCAKGIDERAAAPAFVNDALRSDFHKKFMDRYIK